MLSIECNFVPFTISLSTLTERVLLIVICTEMLTGLQGIHLLSAAGTLIIDVCVVFCDTILG